jgi:hypothetical protein
VTRFPDPERGPAPPSLSDNELDELLGAYALHAVEAEERVLVEEYLQRSPRARAEVNELTEAAAWLGNSSGDRPRDLWSQIADRLEQPPEADAATRNTSNTTGNVVALPLRKRSPLVTRTLAAAAAVVLAGLSTQMYRQTRTIDNQRQQLATKDELLTTEQQRTASMLRQTVTVQNSLKEKNRELTAKIAQTLIAAETYQPRLAKLRRSPGTHSSMLVSNGLTVAEVFVGADGDGFVLGLNLPPLPKDQTYQLWGVKGTTVLSLGVLGPNPTTVPIAANGSWTKLVLTAETYPGVATSTQPAVAVGDVS